MSIERLMRGAQEISRDPYRGIALRTVLYIYAWMGRSRTKDRSGQQKKESEHSLSSWMVFILDFVRWPRLKANPTHVTGPSFIPNWALILSLNSIDTDSYRSLGGLEVGGCLVLLCQRDMILVLRFALHLGSIWNKKKVMRFLVWQGVYY